VDLPDGRAIEYDVDGAGRRVGRRELDASGVEVSFRGWIYRDLLRPIAEVDEAGNVVARYVYEDGSGMRQNAGDQVATRLGTGFHSGLRYRGRNLPEIVELLTPSGAVTQRLSLVSNQVGSVELVVDADTGVVVERLEYDEFGRIALSLGANLQPFGFAGGLQDSDTKVVRFGARDYFPDLGRWSARDPLRMGGGSENTYAYSTSNPVGVTDANGLTIYQCSRWGVGEASFVKHAYTCVDMGSYTECFGHGGESEYDVYDEDNCEEHDNQSSCLDQCVEGEILYGDKSGFDPFNNNCYDWRERTLDECERRCGDY
jgi:RHS repeat-associated protein